MLGLTGKLMIGVSSLAITAVGGVVLKNHLKPRTIGQELTKEKIRLLSEDSNQWDSLVNKYNGSSEAGQGSIPEKIKGLETTVDSQRLKEKCKSLWGTKLSDINGKEEKDRIANELKNWCVDNAKAIDNN